jgi:hypothetical protein
MARRTKHHDPQAPSDGRARRTRAATGAAAATGQEPSAVQHQLDDDPAVGARTVGASLDAPVPAPVKPEADAATEPLAEPDAFARGAHIWMDALALGSRTAVAALALAGHGASLARAAWTPGSAARR